MYQKLHVTGSGPGILYGLPKIHKVTFEAEKLYRPIFAAYNCASYNLSKFLVDILNPFAENCFTLKNSHEFRQQVENIPISDKNVMASFDIKDLYTNVPLQETIDICMDLISSNNLSNLPAHLFRKILELSVFNNLFLFNGQYYRQLDGLGMGLPLSPTLANIFLCFHENKWLNACPSEFKPIFYRRYIDDTFLIFNDVSHVQKFMDYLNSKHPNIKFTSEIESNNQLPFLDCMVQKHGDNLSTSVYRKATFTGQGLSFFSFSSKIFKINSIKTLIARAQRISSTFTALNKELTHLVQYFYENGYPKRLVYNEIRKLAQNKPVITTVPKKQVYASLPFFGTQSEKLKTDILAIIARYFPQLDFKISLTNKYTIGSLFPYKDKLPMALRSKIVYSYSCVQCTSGTYIGSTMRAAYMRISEHRGRSYRTEAPLSSPQHSAIRDHATELSHVIKDSNFKILDQAQNECHLRILESLYIGKFKPKLNNMTSCFPLEIA